MPGPSSSDGDFHVVVLSGPSGSGKTTIVNRLLEQTPIKLLKSISATTRPPRDTEIEAEDYYFLSPEEFEKRRQNGDFLEVAEVFKSGYWYGTLWSELDRAKQEGGWPFLEIDVQGALRVMDEYPNAITIFLKTPSQDEFEKRLRNRETDSEESIQRRLKTAREELKLANRYRHQVVNDDLDQAVDEIADILFSAQETQRHA